MSKNSVQPKREVLTYINPRRKCPTCIREWCDSMRPPEEKEAGCTLWRHKDGAGHD